MTEVLFCWQVPSAGWRYWLVTGQQWRLDKAVVEGMDVAAVNENDFSLVAFEAFPAKPQAAANNDDTGVLHTSLCHMAKLCTT